MRSYTRHQLKHDQFTEAAKGTVHWAVEHRQKLVLGGIVAAVLLGVGLGYWFYQGYRERRAAEALGRAMHTYNAPLRTPEQQTAPAGPSFASASERTKAAHAEFAKVAEQYSRSRSGKLARYFAGTTALAMGDNAKAENELKKVAESANADMAALSKFALAGLYSNTGRQPDAIQVYKQLIERPTATVPKATAQLELAALYASTQPDEARRIYEEVQKDNPQGAVGGVAAARLQQLK